MAVEFFLWPYSAQMQEKRKQRVSFNQGCGLPGDSYREKAGKECLGCMQGRDGAWNLV